MARHLIEEAIGFVASRIVRASSGRDDIGAPALAARNDPLADARCRICKFDLACSGRAVRSVNSDAYGVVWIRSALWLPVPVYPFCFEHGGVPQM